MTRHWPTALLITAFALATGATAQAASSDGDGGHPSTAGQQAAGTPASKHADKTPVPKSDSKSDAADSTTGESAAPVTQPADAKQTSQSAKQGAGSSHSTESSQAPEKDSTEASQASGFSYDRLVAMAKSRADEAYKAPAQVPTFLQKLAPDVYRQIKYKRDDALWKQQKLPFQVMFYHPGSYYTHAVKIHVINGKKVRTFEFDKDRFDYPGDKLKDKVPADLGYAGFKVLHELGTPGKLDEVLSFLGASYFRALGANEHYGLSARGLAIDTGSSQGEEFPNFTQFWLVKPGSNAGKMTIYALLDSPSVAGAYKFVVSPGKATRTHVEATLFTRKAITKLGIAPLTSMFTWGENSLSRLQDYRPEAHDSDGMLISMSDGEWLWRPLVDPQTLWMNQFQAKHVHGFGLMQRDRDFDHYQDLKDDYQHRPNAWVTPDGDWGDGHLELVEIPSDSEVNDNISLYWVPKKPVTAHERLHFVYDIKWSSELSVPDSLGHVVATRVGLAAVAPGKPHDQVRVVIDFAGGELAKLKDPNAVQPHVNAMRDVTLSDIQAIRNPHVNGWRLTFLVPTSALNTPLNLRAYLANDSGGGLTETWTYALKTP